MKFETDTERFVQDILTDLFKYEFIAFDSVRSDNYSLSYKSENLKMCIYKIEILLDYLEKFGVDKSFSYMLHKHKYNKLCRELNFISSKIKKGS